MAWLARDVREDRRVEPALSELAEHNGAEIDGAKVLWARELDEEQNAKLFEYFKDRQVWLVEPDTDNTELIPYQPLKARTDPQ